MDVIVSSSPLSINHLRYWKSLSILQDPDTIQYHPKKKSRSCVWHGKPKVRVDSYKNDNQGGIYFSWRQSQCMILFLKGLTQMEVAELLNISVRTIERYTKDMCLKLNCNNKVELMGLIVETCFEENAIKILEKFYENSRQKLFMT